MEISFIHKQDQDNSPHHVSLPQKQRPRKWNSVWKKKSVKNNQEWVGNVPEKPSLGDSVKNPESSLLLALLQNIFIFLAIIRGVRAFNLISDIQYWLMSLDSLLASCWQELLFTLSPRLWGPAQPFLNPALNHFQSNLLSKNGLFLHAALCLSSPF